MYCGVCGSGRGLETDTGGAGSSKSSGVSGKDGSQQPPSDGWTSVTGTLAGITLVLIISVGIVWIAALTESGAASVDGEARDQPVNAATDTTLKSAPTTRPTVSTTDESAVEIDHPDRILRYVGS